MNAAPIKSAAPRVETMHWRFILLCATAAVTVAEDASKPHIHSGVFRQHKIGPPSKAGLSVIKGGAVQKFIDGHKESKVEALAASPSSPKGTMRCSSIQYVNKPPSVVWKVLMDFPRYPSFVGGITSCKPYSRRRTLTGGQLVGARYTVKISPIYKIHYFLEHHHEPMKHTMTWSLDYSRLSDLYDSVGYWHVEAHGTGSMVYYTQDSLLPSWIPGPLKKTFTNVAMRSATSQLEPACIKVAEESERKGLGGLMARRPKWLSPRGE